MPRLSQVRVAELAGIACPYCGRTVTPDTPWAVSAATLWGSCGVKLMDRDVLAGVLLLGPTDDRSTAMVMCAWVRPELIGAGYGRQLVQAAAAQMLEHKVRTVMAQGSRRTARCSAPPRDFLREVGFVRAGDERLWRLDLDRTVADRNGVRSVFERLMESLRPVSPPEPAGGAISGRASRGSS